MADLYITEQGTTIHKHSESIHLKKDGEKYFEIELKNVDTIQIFGNIQYSSQTLQELLKRGIDLGIYSYNGDLLGRIIPPYSKNILLRFHQYDLYQKDHFRLDFAKELMRFKVSHSIELMSDHSKNSSTDYNSEIRKLKQWKKKIDTAQGIEELLGLEGSFASQYFDLFGCFFKDASVFSGRSKRPPKDEGNSILSFLYTLITNRLGSYLNGISLDPYIGFYHSMDYGRESLACDLIEPIRSLFCDRLTLKIFNKNLLKKEDFESRDGGFYLQHESRKKFFEIYSKEIHSINNYGITKGTLLEYMDVISSWAKECIQEGKVSKLE